MTERILRALGETDEKYILAYAGKMKEKNPKKIVLRRCLSVAAAVTILVGCISFLFLYPHQKGIKKEKYSNYEDMINRTYGYVVDTHLSSLNFEEYDKVKYFCYVNHTNQSDMFEVSYVVTLYKERTKTEILFLPATIHYEYNLSYFLPEITNAEEEYTEEMELNGTLVRYGQEKDRVFGAFEDETGFYKIICHSNQIIMFENIVTDLLN